MNGIFKFKKKIRLDSEFYGESSLFVRHYLFFIKYFYAVSRTWNMPN